MVTSEKRIMSYLSVSARIRVIDPFSQIKREDNMILEEADSANPINFVRETFLKVTKNEM